MPIQLNCGCGKQLRVPEEHAGKRIKCTACGQIQAVPAARNAVKQPVAVKAAAKPAPAVPPRPASPASITSSCEECGRTIKARLEYVGKKVKCPDCGAAVLIADPDEEVVEEVTEKRAAPSRVAAGKPSKSRPKPIVEEEEVSEDDEVAEEVEEEEEEEERPRKKKKGKKGKKEKAGSKTMLWVGIGSGAAVLLGGVVFALVWFLSGPSGKNAANANNPGGPKVPLTGEMALLAPDAAVIGVVQVSELWKSPLGKDLAKTLTDQGNGNPLAVLTESGISPGDIIHFGVALKDISNPKGWWYVTTSKPMDQAKILEMMEIPGDAKSYQNTTYYIAPNRGNSTVHFASPTMLVSADNEENIKEVIDRLAGRKQSQGTAMAKAIEQVDKHPIVVGFTIPSALKGGGMGQPGRKPPVGFPGGNGMEKMAPPEKGARPGDPGMKGRPIPPGMDGGQRPGGGMQGRPVPPGMQGGPGMQDPPSPLGKLVALQVGLVTIDVNGNNVAVETTGTFPSEAAAKDALADLEKQKKELGGALLLAAAAGHGPPKQVTDTLNQTTMTQNGSQVTIKAAIEITSDMIKLAFPDRGFGPPPDKGKPAGSRRVMENNLKQLGLAFHNYLSANNVEFPAVFSPKGKPFSWRVAVLPFIEEQAIYSKLHLDEDWDSPHNLEVAKSMMPRCYKPVGRTAEPGETFMKTFTGPDTIFGMKNLCNIKNLLQKGTSNAILFVEAEKPVIWTKPEDISYSPNLDIIAELFWLSGTTTVTMGDGSIKWIKKSVPNEEFHNTINQKIQKPGKLD